MKKKPQKKTTLRNTQVRTSTTDITEYKKAKTAEENGLLLRLLVKAAAEGIVLVNDKGEIIMTNLRCEEIFGYNESELLGKKVETLIPDRFKTSHVTHRKGFVKEHRMRPMGFGMNLFGKRKNGTEFPLEVALSSFQMDGRRFVTAFITDITKRKKAEDTAGFLASIVNNSDVFIIRVSKERIIQSWNMGAEKLYGYSSKEAIGKSVSMLAPENLKKEIGDIYRRVSSGEHIEHYETKHVRKRGEMIDVSLTISPIRDEKGGITGTATIAKDITKQKAFEKNLLDAIVQGQELERERLAKELHDGLGVLMLAAKANLGALEPGIEQLGKERTVYFNNSLTLLDDAIRETRTIISDLSPHILEARGLVAALKDLCDKIDQSHKFSVKFYSSIEGRFSKQIEQTLYRIGQELINNAVKYSKAETITMQLVRHDDLLTLSVEDNGIGFDTKHFLFRRDGNGHRNIAGRAKHLNGIFHIDSSIGNGALASVEVPLV